MFHIDITLYWVKCEKYEIGAECEIDLEDSLQNSIEIATLILLSY